MGDLFGVGEGEMIEAARTESKIARRVIFFLFRVPEELYDYQQLQCVA